MIRCILTELLQCEADKKCQCAINLSESIQSPWFFDHFSSGFNALSECVTGFNRVSSIYTWVSSVSTEFEPYGFTWSEPSWPQFNDLYFGSYEELACPKLIF